MAIMQDRRTEVRMMCADMVEVTWNEGNNRTRRTMALLEDISRSGACLQLEMPLPLGALIRWGSGGHRFEGYVRHCIYRSMGYFAGIQLADCSRWSTRVYRPKHLLNPARVVGKPMLDDPAGRN
jgi:hypothetical protein